MTLFTFYVPSALGYGRPTSAISCFLPLFVSLSISSGLFPFMIMLAVSNRQVPANEVERCREHVINCKIFTPSYAVTEKVLKWLEGLLLAQGIGSSAPRSTQGGAQGSAAPTLPAASNAGPAAPAAPLPQRPPLAVPPANIAEDLRLATSRLAMSKS